MVPDFFGDALLPGCGVVTWGLPDNTYLGTIPEAPKVVTMSPVDKNKLYLSESQW